MASFKNIQGITRIKFVVKSHNFCPLGKAWYTNTLQVELTPGEIIPDYDEVQQQLLTLDGQHLIIEDAVEKTYALLNMYQPQELTVTSKAEGNGHFPVIVEKSSA